MKYSKEDKMRGISLAVSLLAALMLSLPLRSHGDTYAMHILRGGDISFGSDINDSGQIVGTTHTYGLPYTIRAVLWDSYDSDPLSLDEENRSANGQLINNSGLVIGKHDSPPGSTMPFKWSAGVLTDIDVPFVPEAVNDSGVMVGFCGGGGPPMLPVVVSRTGQLTYLNSIWGDARDINDSGYIAGESDFNGEGYACLWHEGDEAVDIGAFGGTWSVATGINNIGQVVGVYGGDNGAIGNFVWSLNHDTIFIPTCPLLDYGSFGPIDINDNGVVLGTGEINGVHKVVTWSLAGGLTIVGTGDPHAINNFGYIVGTLEEFYGPGPSQAIVWEPVPEPSAFLALAGGMIGLLAGTRKRQSR